MDAKVLSDICDGFNSLLKKLVGDLVGHFSGDHMLIRTKKGLSLLANMTPVQCMTKTGEHLFKYRNEIMGDSSDDFFDKHDFSSDIDQINDKDEAEMTGYALKKMKELVPKLEEKEIEKYREMLRDMLDYYLEYLASQ